MRSPVLVSLLAAFSLAVTGCAELLPKSAVRTEVQWQSFDDARAMVQAIKPYQTTKADLAGAGLSDANPAVTLLSHVEVAVRFPIGGVLNESDVDPGIRDCLKAGKACNAYQINVHRTNRNRVGNFWLDALRFRRETDVSGWTFNALVLFVDDLVVYAVFGGQPVIHEVEVERNPLGPLQGWGDWAASKALN